MRFLKKSPTSFLSVAATVRMIDALFVAGAVAEVGVGAVGGSPSLLLPGLVIISGSGLFFSAGAAVASASAWIASSKLLDEALVALSAETVRNHNVITRTEAREHVLTFRNGTIQCLKPILLSFDGGEVGSRRNEVTD